MSVSFTCLAPLKVIPTGDMEGKGKDELTGGGVGWVLGAGAREDRGRRVSLKTQGRGALAAEQASTVDRVWYVSCELKRPFTLERGWILGRAGGQRVGTWARKDWEGTNEKLLGLVGWSSANKSVAVG